MIVTFVLGIIAADARGYRLNTTFSMPVGLYRVSSGSMLAVGDLAAVCPPGKYASLALERGYLRGGACDCGTERMLKVVEGLPGDLLDVGPEGIRVNGRLIPESRILSEDSLKRPMPSESTVTTGPIPAGQALLMSDGHPRGFDSRYFGLVPLSGLEKVKPVWTVGKKGDL